MLNPNGEKTTNFKRGEDITIRFDYEVKKEIEKLNFGFTVRDAEEKLIFMSDKRNANNLINGEIGKHSLEIKIDSPPLLGGTYLISGELWDNDSTFFVGFSNKRKFTITQTDYIGSGIISLSHKFTNQ